MFGLATDMSTDFLLTYWQALAIDVSTGFNINVSTGFSIAALERFVLAGLVWLLTC